MLAYPAARLVVAAGELPLAEERMPVALVEVLEAALKAVKAPKGARRHALRPQAPVVLEGGNEAGALEDPKLHVVARQRFQPGVVKRLLQRQGLADVVLDGGVQRADQLDHQGLQAMRALGKVEDAHSQSSQ
jgi:hypothetical protein